MASTLIDMSASNKGKRGRPPGLTPGERKPAKTLYVRLSPSLGEKFDLYVDSLRPRVSKTNVIEFIIEQFLESVKLGEFPEK